MAKKINVKVIQSIEGRPYQIPTLDEDGNAATDSKGNLITRDATTVDVLRILIRAFPRDKMTFANIAEGVRLMHQLDEADNSTLIMDESTHDWIKKMLRDDGVGVKIFGFNLFSILDALDDFERKHEAKDGQGTTE
jgi:hypothetical protein